MEGERPFYCEGDCPAGVGLLPKSLNQSICSGQRGSLSIVMLL